MYASVRFFTTLALFVGASCAHGSEAPDDGRDRDEALDVGTTPNLNTPPIDENAASGRGAAVIAMCDFRGAGPTNFSISLLGADSVRLRVRDKNSSAIGPQVWNGELRLARWCSNGDEVRLGLRPRSDNSVASPEQVVTLTYDDGELARVEGDINPMGPIDFGRKDGCERYALPQALDSLRSEASAEETTCS